MADPATQFQQAGLNIPYQFSPTVTRLNPPIQLPGTGELWAKVGQTALDAAQQAGEMLQKSPLNPAVKASIDYGVTQYKAAQDHIAWLKNQNQAGQMAQGTGAEGLETVPIGGAGFNPQVALQVLAGTPPPKKEGGPGKGNDPGDSSGKGNDPGGGPGGAPPGTFLNPATGSYEPLQTTQPATTPTQPTTTPTQPAKPSTDVAGDLYGQNQPDLRNRLAQETARGGLSASTNNDYLLTRMEQERAAALGGGQTPGPSSMAPMTPQPPGPMTPSPSMFGGRAVAPPPAPETPGPSSMPMSPQGSAISQITDQPGVALANWQNQNVHPVIAPSAVLQAVKNNVTTKAQHATYLPNGGVNGEPAYSIDLQGGGQTLLSASQIAKAPWGRTLMSEHNQSEVMEAQQQGQPGPQSPAAPAPPPPQTPGPSSMAPMQPQTSGPPAAPSSPPPQTYPQIASDQGGAQGAPAAPGAYNAEALRAQLQPFTSAAGTAANPQNVTAGTTAAGQPASTESDTLPVPADMNSTNMSANLKTYSQDQLGKMTEDPPVGNFGGLQWFQDRNYGQIYARMKSPSSTLNQERLIWGNPHWQDMPMDDSAQRQQLRDARSTTPVLAKLTDDEIRTMPPARVGELLNAAALNQSTKADPLGPIAQHVQGTINQSQSLARQIDLIEAAEKAGIDRDDYNQTALDRNAAAEARGGGDPGHVQSVFNWQQPAVDTQFGLKIENPVDWYRNKWAQWHNIEASGQPVQPLAKELRQEVKYHTDQLTQTPGITYSADGKPVATRNDFSIGGIPIHNPLGEPISPIPQIQRIFAGKAQSAQDVIDGLKQVKKRTDDDLIHTVDEARRSQYRVPPEWKDAVSTLQSGKDIPDLTNLARDLKTGNLTFPDSLRQKPAPGDAAPVKGPDFFRWENPLDLIRHPTQEAAQAPTPAGQPAGPPEMKNMTEVADFMKTRAPDSPFMYDTGDGRGPQRYWTPKR